MTTTIGRLLGVSAATVALALFAYGAQAQEKKMEPPKTAPKTEKKQVACNTLKTQQPCEARSDCNWVGETKNDKGKVTKKAYCRANPGTKKADEKKAEVKKTDEKKK